MKNPSAPVDPPTSPAASATRKGSDSDKDHSADDLGEEQLSSVFMEEMSHLGDGMMDDGELDDTVPPEQPGQSQAALKAAHAAAKKAAKAAAKKARKKEQKRKKKDFNGRELGGLKANLSQEDGTLLGGVKPDLGGQHYEYDFEFQMSQSGSQAEEIDRLTREVQDLFALPGNKSRVATYVLELSDDVDLIKDFAKAQARKYKMKVEEFLEQGATHEQMWNSFKEVTGRPPKMDELNITHMIEATVSSVSKFTKYRPDDAAAPAAGVIRRFSPDLGDVVYFVTDDGTEVRGVVMSVQPGGLCETARGSEFFSAREVSPIRLHDKYESEFGWDRDMDERHLAIIRRRQAKEGTSKGVNLAKFDYSRHMPPMPEKNSAAHIALFALKARELFLQFLEAYPPSLPIDHSEYLQKFYEHAQKSISKVAGSLEYFVSDLAKLLRTYSQGKMLVQDVLEAILSMIDEKVSKQKLQTV